MQSMSPADPSAAAIVIIDDDLAARSSIEQMLRLRRYRTHSFPSAESALASSELANADCVLTDVMMPGMTGEEFLAEAARRGLAAPVVMITGHGDVGMAVRCLKAGAYDFVEKPFDDEVLLSAVDRAVESRALRREREDLRRRLQTLPAEEDGRWGMVGRSRAMRALYAQIEVVARSSAPVLITGETGAGKELAARAVHAASPRAAGPFVPVNAGALPETMLESELFGHARGAFTGAVGDRAGKLLTASGGTLLLDEVESISVRAQVQLLRVVEDGVVHAVGDDTPRHADVRIIALTNVDLKDQVRQGHIREDFYHRVAALTVHVPPLRDRTEDIPLLVAHFLHRSAERLGIAPPKVSDRSLAEMTRYGWPGNVRELRHAVERMTVSASGGVAGPFAAATDADAARLLSLPAGAGRLHDEMERTERHVIEASLREHAGEVTATAAALGISRRALYERMKKYGLDKDDYRIS